jgi:predicted nucleic acid-binding protein
MDSSAITALALREEGAAEIDEMLDRAEDHDLGAVSLDLAKVEAVNAVWKHCSLLKDLRPAAASRLVEGIEGLNYEFRRLDPPMLADAFQIAQKHRVTVYDSVFIELLRRVKGILVTADGRQAAVARNYGKVVLVGSDR